MELLTGDNNHVSIWVDKIEVESDGVEATVRLVVERGYGTNLGGEPPITDLPQDIHAALLRWLNGSTR